MLPNPNVTIRVTLTFHADEISAHAASQREWGVNYLMICIAIIYAECLLSAIYPLDKPSVIQRYSSALLYEARDIFKMGANTNETNTY
jgi:hypothetical protein